MRVKVPRYVGEKLVGLSKKDLTVTFFRSSGPGGQHRNKVDTACRIRHNATGITAEATDSRSQSTNKQEAFKKLVDKLINYYKSELPTEERRMNTGWQTKIRTYHQPRGTVKDHRTGVVADYGRVLDGDIDVFITAAATIREEGSD